MVRTVGIISDFSTDYYHGVMKAVITQSNQRVNFVDLSVNQPQSIINAAWILLNSIQFFPKNSVFLVVVDPGVGTSRKPLIVKLQEHWVILPDNGIITPFKEQLEETYAIYSNQNMSSTFHGRDLFSPAVRDIILNRNLSEFTKEIAISELNFLNIDIKPRENSGIVTDIDSFGNIVTNVIFNKLYKESINLKINNNEMNLQLVHTFSDLKENVIGAIIGSCNTLELVINQGSASKQLKIKIGDPVIIL